jgi:hypothetical protein
MWYQILVRDSIEKQLGYREETFVAASFFLAAVVLHRRSCLYHRAD